MKKYLKNYSLKNKNILITGGAGTLGKQFSLALLEAGARVVITDHNEKKLKKFNNEIFKKNKKSSVNHFVLDVSSENSIQDVLKKIRKIKNKNRRSH